MNAKTIKSLKDSNIRSITCLSCGKPARLSNEDGFYCKDCMEIHLLEKMFVQVTKLAEHR